MYKFDLDKYWYWSDIAKVSFLQRVIIIHSILYYEHDNPLWTDKQYDDICRQLVQEQRNMDYERFKRTQYFYCMHDFDGTTGFDIVGRITDDDKDYLMKLVSHIRRRGRR